MFVIIDQFDDGHFHFIETDPIAYPMVEHPDGVTGKVGVDVMLKHHNANPDAREKGGWHIARQLPGEDREYTRWERLVAACNHPDAHPQAKALGLK